MIKDQNFRGDVELLRAIAVILVVLFHLKISAIQSGFIGVDIFFVISGYLMAAAFSSKDSSILMFYERRARRVLPAAMVIFLTFFLISPFLFLPFEAKKIAEPFWGMIFFAPNLIFWKIDDYFSALIFSPTLHYWSLGVELQYYIFFPIVVYFIRGKNYLYAAIGLASLLGCIVITHLSNKTGFFLMPFRVWEFFCGLAAFKIFTSGKLNRFSNSTGGSVTFFLLIAVLVIYSFLPIPQNEFPGIYAIPPALLTGLAIAIGMPETKLNAIYGIAPLRWIGRLSYSIYLIHFIVFFIFFYAPFSAWKQLTLVEELSAVVITLILSAISYRYLESPFRNRKLIPSKTFIGILLGIYILSAATIIVYEKQNYFSARLPIKEQFINSSFDDMGGFRCSKLQKLKEYGESSCYLYQTQQPLKTIYLVGDSQIDAIKEVFIESAKTRNINVRLNRDRCFLGEGQCSSSAIITQIEKYGISDVVFHAWDYDKFNYSDLQNFVNWSKEHNINIHFIGPIPTYSQSIPESLYKEVKLNATMIERKSKQDHLQSISPKFLEFKDTNKNVETTIFYSPEDYFCPDECLLENDQGVFYYDAHHPTKTGARLLAPLVDSILNR